MVTFVDYSASLKLYQERGIICVKRTYETYKLYSIHILQTIAKVFIYTSYKRKLRYLYTHLTNESSGIYTHSANKNSSIYIHILPTKAQTIQRKSFRLRRLNILSNRFAMNFKL